MNGYLSRAEVTTHGLCLDPPLSWRIIERAIAAGVVEHPTAPGRGRGAGRAGRYPPAVRAQLDAVAAARRRLPDSSRATKRIDPAWLRQCIWWRGGPTGAPVTVRSALYERVRADWGATLARCRYAVDCLRAQPAGHDDMWVRVARLRGLRALDVRLPRDECARMDWAEQVRAGVGLGPAEADVLTEVLAGRQGPEADGRLLGAALVEVLTLPVGAMPEAVAEALCWGLTVRARAEGGWPGLGDDPHLTALLVGAEAVNAGFLRPVAALEDSKA